MWEDNDSTLNVKCYDDPSQQNTINDQTSNDDTGNNLLSYGQKPVLKKKIFIK